MRKRPSHGRTVSLSKLSRRVRGGPASQRVFTRDIGWGHPYGRVVASSDGIDFTLYVFAIIYITNRYSAEQEMIEIEKKLKTELTEVRYRALTVPAASVDRKDTAKPDRKSLRQTPDSVLQSPKEPPF